VREALKRIALSMAQGLMIITGVALVLFLLFYALPNQKPETVSVSLVDQFLGYANELSFVSYATSEEASSDWNTWFAVPVAGGDLVFKWPYLGRSASANQRVFDIISGAMPETIALILSSLSLALLLGVSLGVFQSRTKSWFLKNLIAGVTSVGMAVPSFVASILLAWVFGYLWSDLTGLKMTGSLFTYDVYASEDRLTLSNIILPTLALSLRPMAIIAQLVESKVDEIYQLDYIRTARANGLSERAILLRHVMPNASSTLLSAAGSLFVSLLIGGVFVEFIFGWKGFGHVVVNAIQYQDFRLIMGVTLVVSVTYILVNSLIEYLNPLVDPSVRKN
jgi:peptide/nickel transport system permease protein